MCNITLTEKECSILMTMCGIAIYNGNHFEPKAFNPTPEEYAIICQLFNQIIKAAK